MASSGGPLGIHHDAALQIIRLPLPQRQQSFDNDSSESIEMDFMTATSLNSENIQASQQAFWALHPNFTGLQF
jgi:hypothetical protein